jgi:hypothetical protein
MNSFEVANCLLLNRTYQNAMTGRPEKLKLRGDRTDYETEITLGSNGDTVARICRPSESSDKLAEDEGYVLSVAPNGMFIFFSALLAMD